MNNNDLTKEQSNSRELKTNNNHIKNEFLAEMNQVFEKLNTLADSEKREFPISEKEALQIAQKSFEEYLKAELAYQEILVYPVTGDALANTKKYVQMLLCQQRMERLEESINYHKFE